MSISPDIHNGSEAYYVCRACGHYTLYWERPIHCENCHQRLASNASGFGWETQARECSEQAEADRIAARQGRSAVLRLRRHAPA